MAKDTRPTLAQESLLREYGLEPLHNISTTALLIEFIKDGNCTTGNTSRERAAIWEKAREELVGKRVSDKIYVNQPGEEAMAGTITYLLPRSAKEVRRKLMLDKTMLGRLQARAPFKLCIKWDAGKKTIVAFSSVAIHGLPKELITLSGDPLTFSSKGKLFHVVEGSVMRFVLWFNKTWHMNRYGFRGDCDQKIISEEVRSEVFDAFKLWAGPLDIPDLDGKLCKKH